GRAESGGMAVAVPRSAESERAPDERFEALVLDFLAYMEFERGLSRNTLDAYRTDLLQYGAFLAGRATGGGGRPPASAATINRKAACLRSFYRHLRRQELVGDDPTARLAPPAKSRRLPRVLSYAEVKRLLESVRGADPIALRDRALLEVMYGCGLRAS